MTDPARQPSAPDPEPDEGPEMSFEVTEPAADETLVTISGELDISNIPRLAGDVEGALARQPRRLVVDVSGVRFADSSAIALWLQWSTAVTEFELRKPPVLLRAVISTMGLGEQLGIPA